MWILPATLMILVCIAVVIGLCHDPKPKPKYLLVRFSDGKYAIKHVKKDKYLDLKSIIIGNIHWWDINDYYMRDCLNISKNVVSIMFKQYLAITLEVKPIIIQELDLKTLT